MRTLHTSRFESVAVCESRGGAPNRTEPNRVIQRNSGFLEGLFWGSFVGISLKETRSTKCRNIHVPSLLSSPYQLDISHRIRQKDTKNLPHAPGATPQPLPPTATARPHSILSLFLAVVLSCKRNTSTTLAECKGFNGQRGQLEELKKHSNTLPWK